MEEQRTRQGSLTGYLRNDDYLETWLDAFLFDRKAQNMAAGTLQFYRVKLKSFAAYCEAQAINRVSQITPNELRRFMVYLDEHGHTPGGQHAIYRAVKTFLLWFEDETEPENWKNPIRKVKPPKVPTEPLEPVEIETVKAMAAACKRGTFLGDRDQAILLCLLDTGVRAAELVAIDLADVNQARGDVLIRQGKGRKPRTVYMGKQSRKAVRAYLRRRRDNHPALWVTDEGDQLTYWGLRHVIRRCAQRAGVEKPSLHDFRRGFAITMLRNGCDLVTLSRLMGHESLIVLQRYLKQIPDDLQEAHRRGSPVDTKW